MNSANHPADATQLARLRWRARRGLLENDLIIERFFDKFEFDLTHEDVEALTALFELTDNHLLDVLLGRKALEGDLDKPHVRKVVQRMQAI